MRKLKLQMQISLDGYVAGPNGEMDWMVMNWDNELNNYVKDLTEPVDTIVLGRVLAEGFIDTWGNMAKNTETTEDFTYKMVETPKVVFSKTLKEHSWKNATLADGDVIEEITNLKKKDGGDMIAYGGGSFVSSLIQNNLIDEYHLFINPVMLGGGLPIMDKLAERLLLNHVESKGFACGITLVSYIPSN